MVKTRSEIAQSRVAFLAYSFNNRRRLGGDAAAVADRGTGQQSLPFDCSKLSPPHSLHAFLSAQHLFNG